MGRFTAPDPAKDLRGDGDLYDYCVDDPVSCVDPAGLWGIPLLFAAGKALSTAIAGAGLYGAASLVGHGAKEAIDEVFPITAGIQTAIALPGLAVAGGQALAPLARQAGTAVGTAANAAWQRFGPPLAGAAAAATGAATNAAQRIGASPYGDKIITGITHAAQFAESFIFPGLPMVPSAPGTIGTVVEAAYDWYKEQKDKSKK